MTAFQDPRLSRRQFLAAASITAAGGWAALASSRFAWADQAPAVGEQGIVQMMRNGAATAKVESKHLGKNVYILTGSGGNIGVLTGDEGVLLVDSGLAGSQPQIRKELSIISGKPLQYVINTHWHFDHCDGNAWTRAAGATIIAHPNTKRHLSQETRVPDWNFTFPPAPDEALPSDVVADSKRFKFSNVADVDIRHYGFPCHTDGDLFVHFPDADVLQTGDTFWNGHYPFIDTANGGSIGGTLRATEVNLKLVGEKTQIIPGHGPVASRADLAEFRDMIAGVQEAVAKLKKEGKTVEEAIAAKPTAKWDAKYAGFVITPEHFTRIAYAGV